jgi:hypothetical protein
VAKKIIFPLKMADDTQVRTVDELREHFDLAAVLGYYNDGRLLKWLSDRYYEDEAKKIEEFDSTSDDFKEQLCSILGASFAADDNVNLTEITIRNERREGLKRFTADDKILAAIDSVAFTQEELTELLGNDISPIYLCGERFAIPGSKGGVTYIGVNNPHVEAPAAFTQMGITFENVTFDVEGIIQCAKEAKDPAEALNYWSMAAEQGSAEAQYTIGSAYIRGTFNLTRNYEEAGKWIYKAADQGYDKAMNLLKKMSNLFTDYKKS